MIVLAQWRKVRTFGIFWGGLVVSVLMKVAAEATLEMVGESWSSRNTAGEEDEGGTDKYSWFVLKTGGIGGVAFRNWKGAVEAVEVIMVECDRIFHFSETLDFRHSSTLLIF